MKLITLIKALGIIILVSASIYLFFFTDVKSNLTVEHLRATVNSYGYWSPFFFIILFAILTTLFIPASLLTIPSGIIYGTVKGFTLNFIGAMFGAIIAFLIARFLGKEFISKLLDMPYFRRITDFDSSLEKHGFYDVVILRLIPFIPFIFLNYALGVSKVKVKDYLLGTAVGLIPTLFLFAYFGSSLATLNWFSLSISAALILLIFLASNYFKKKKLEKVLKS